MSIQGVQCTSASNALSAQSRTLRGAGSRLMTGVRKLGAVIVVLFDNFTSDVIRDPDSPWQIHR